MLECVINVSEGRRRAVIEAIAGTAGACLLDVHSDPDHHRSVLTLAGPASEVQEAARVVARVAVALIDLRGHAGAHPRLGALDVVPFVDLTRPTEASPDAIAARDAFARWVASELAVPAYLYGPLPGDGERTLPEVRKQAFMTLPPDHGTTMPHETAGAVTVGARPVLVAYNVWLATRDVSAARAIARNLRSPSVRALGLSAAGQAQVTMNLIDPFRVGPAAAYDAVAARAEVARAELVGLVPEAVMADIPQERWADLDLDLSRTIEARMEEVSG